MPQSSDPLKQKTEEEALFEIPDNSDIDKTTAYFNIAVQSIWGTVVSMVETQRRIQKQLQAIRHNYNRLSDATEAMIATMNSPYDNPLYHKRKSNAASILRENSKSVGSDILSIPSAPSVEGNQNDTNSDVSPVVGETNTNIKNLWKRK